MTEEEEYARGLVFFGRLEGIIIGALACRLIAGLMGWWT
jgi:hypothetical protein